jgi:hypothetical protein
VLTNFVSAIYIKINWAADVALSVDNLNHVQTQWDEMIADIDAHAHDWDYYTRSEMESTFWYAGNDGPESGCDADMLDGHHAGDISAGVPSGFICYWYGGTGDIPDGFYYCNGSNGTPDLRDQLIVCAGDEYAVGVTGGSASVKAAASVSIASHVLTIAEIKHQHTYCDYLATGSVHMYVSGPYYSDYYPSNAVNHLTSTSSVGSGGSHNHPGTFAGDELSIMPPFRALVPMMKS